MGKPAKNNSQKEPVWTRHQDEAGQVLLLVVLASVIALTVGLAAISRSITNTRISTEESNSQKALSAAEAGIEEQINRALSGDVIIGEDPFLGNLSNDSSFTSNAGPVKPAANTAFELNNGEDVKQDEGADIWLSNYPDFTGPITTTLTIWWQTTGDCNKDPAIEVAVIYEPTGNKNNPNMSRYAYDSCTRGNNFTFPGGGTTINDNIYQRSLTFNVNGGFIARVIPLYNDAKIAVRSTESLPSQGYVIDSTGSAGDTVRKLRVFQGFPRLPIEFFPYNLFLP